MKYAIVNLVDVVMPRKAYGSKKKKRRKAPKGYHYMPDGKLMKGATHASTKKKKRKKKKRSY